MSDMSTLQWLPLNDLYEEYLRDESRISGTADSIAFPANEDEIVALLKDAANRNLPVTVQGSRTGIAGAAVPAGGLVMNLTKMNQISKVESDQNGQWSATVASGVLCSQLAEELSRIQPALFFAAEPTETSATLGGMFGCNAQGIASLRYGKAGDHVLGLRMVQWDGSILVLQRGQCIFDAEGCTMPDGRRLGLPQKEYSRLTEALSPLLGSDLIDVLAGSEGMLGIVTELTVQLCPVPHQRWGVLFFFQTLGDGYSFMDSTLALEQENARTVCVEFFDEAALQIVTRQKVVMSRLKVIPDLPQDCCCGVYVELEAPGEGEAEELLMELLGFFEEANGREEDSWAADGIHEMEKFRLLRHAVPEGVNAAVDRIRLTRPEACKIGLDFSCKGETPGKLIEGYRLALEQSGVPGVIFGHAATGHLHLNLLPETDQQVEAAQALLERLAAEMVKKGGCLAEENGIGKAKSGLLARYLSEEQRQVMKTVKEFFDPKGLLNPKNMLL